MPVTSNTVNCPSSLHRLNLMHNHVHPSKTLTHQPYTCVVLCNFSSPQDDLQQPRFWKSPLGVKNSLLTFTLLSSLSVSVVIPRNSHTTCTLTPPVPIFCAFRCPAEFERFERFERSALEPKNNREKKYRKPWDSQCSVSVMSVVCFALKLWEVVLRYQL